jgi:hypothetical protein
MDVRLHSINRGVAVIKPKQRDWRTFKKWFDVEIHSVVLDTTRAAIVKDPTEW